MNICYASLAQDILSEIDQVHGKYDRYIDLKVFVGEDIVTHEIETYTWDCFPGVGQKDFDLVTEEFKKLINSRS